MHITHNPNHGPAPRRLSIAQFNDAYPPVIDGVVTCVHNYAYWLSRKYGDCTLFVPDKRGAVYDQPYRVIGYRSVPLIRRRPYRMGMPALDMHYRTLLETMRFDIVHAHSPFSAGAEALRLGRARGIPVIATFHSKYYDDIYAYTKSKWVARQAIRLIIRRFEQMDSVWAVSESAAKTLVTYGYRGKITVMPNGTDLVMPKDPALLAARSEEVVSIPPDTPVFLFVGQMIWQKNLRMIVDACKLLHARGVRFHMLMVGEGPARRELQAIVDKAGLSHCFTFPGVIMDRELLAALYLHARVLVFPSIYDNAPLVVREAAAMACPSIVVDGSNAAQGISHGINGILCEDNEQSLCDALCYALGANAAYIGISAQRTLSRGWESIVDDVYAAYGNILRQYNTTSAAI